jgi:hypothetical protein
MEALMAVSVRFFPAHCPGCGSPVDANYSHYRHAPRHRLFAPLLIVGVIVVIGMILISLWGTSVLITALTEGQQMHRMDRGMLFCLAFAATVPVIAWLGWLWWRFIHRLPRTLAYECRTCNWSGAVHVVDTSTPVEVDNQIQIVARTEFEGMPAPPDPLDAKRERLQRRIEREQRQAREGEHELPPNPDFDFRE